jgi:hypothetical protein
VHVQRRGWCHLKARDLLFLVGYHTSRLQPCSAGHRPSSAHCAATLTSRPKPRQRKKGTCLLQAFSPASSSNPGTISRQSITVLLSHTARAARVCSVKVVYDLRRSNASYFSGRSALSSRVRGVASRLHLLLNPAGNNWAATPGRQLVLDQHPGGLCTHFGRSCVRARRPGPWCGSVYYTVR